MTENKKHRDKKHGREWRLTLGFSVGMIAGLMFGLAVDCIAVGACSGLALGIGLDCLDAALAGRCEKGK